MLETRQGRPFSAPITPLRATATTATSCGGMKQPSQTAIGAAIAGQGSYPRFECARSGVSNKDAGPASDAERPWRASKLFASLFDVVEIEVRVAKL